VNELYRETSDTADRGAAAEPAHDSQLESTRYEQPDYGHYTETTAETEARIAAEDELPTPDEVREATWGDNPEYYDETNLGEDGDYDAVLPDDDLPSPDEVWERTWGESPEYYDETDLDGDSGDSGSVTENDAPSEDTARPGETRDEHVQHPETEDRDGASPELPAGDNDKPSSPEMERLTALEAKYDQQIADLKAEVAELKAAKDERASQSDSFEQRLPGSDQQRGEERRAPERRDEPGSSPDHGAKSPTIAERKANDLEADKSDEQRAWWRRTASGDNLGIAGAVVGVAGETAALMNVAPEGVGIAGLGGAIFSLGAAVKTKYEKHRKGKA
jgi:hypothetical protein